MQLFHSFNEINWLAVAVVTILSFALGAFWHSVLFKKTWTKDSGTIYNASNHGNPLVVFGLSGLLHLIAVIALAALIGSTSSAIDGLLSGFFSEFSLDFNKYCRNLYLCWSHFALVFN